MIHLPLLLLTLATLPRALAQNAPPPIPADTVVKTTASGLKYSVLKPGEGTRTPHPGEHVKVHYTGWLTDGTPFDSSRPRKQPFEFDVGEKQVIDGWDEALQLMTKGSQIKITLPPALGYGDAGSPPVIPPKATLVFEIELLDFTAMPDFHAANPAKQQKTPSGLVYEVLTEGEGAAPKLGAPIKLRYALWTPQGKLVDSSEMHPSLWRIEGVVGNLAFPFSNQGLAFANEAAQLLKPGSRYRFEVPPALAFGSREHGADLPPNSTTVWELENVKPAGPAFAMSDPSKLQKTASGLGYEVLREGTGRQPGPTSRVKVNYAGWLTNGQQFDSSYERGQPLVFGLNQVIKGWTEGVQLMKEGGMIRLTVPGELGYGARGEPRAAIPPNATLVFVVELLSIES